jgi:hypothetical protein
MNEAAAGPTRREADGRTRSLAHGHPVLRQPASPLPPEELHTPAMAQLLKDMVDTLHAYGGIGLAAPQIGVSWAPGDYPDPWRAKPLWRDSGDAVDGIREP